MKLTEQRSSMLHGVLLMALFACAAFYLGDMEFAKTLSFSPMIIGIILGMLYANSLRNNLPETWTPGIVFCSKRILRFGIILYGFKLTFQDITAVGLPAIIIDAIVVTVTILLGLFVGKLLKMDRSIALLTACGSAICGAARLWCGRRNTSEALQNRCCRSHSSYLWHPLHVPLSRSLSCWRVRFARSTDGYFRWFYHTPK